jgi:hypothetical protein
MKNLLNSVAIAAVLAITGPAWAQNPATPGAAGAGVPPASPPPTSATIPAHHAVRHAHAMHAHHKQMAHKAGLAGDTTAQLNREELARIQAGTPPAPPPGAGQPAGQMPPPKP